MEHITVNATLHGPSKHAGVPEHSNTQGPHKLSPESSYIRVTDAQRTWVVCGHMVQLPHVGKDDVSPLELLLRLKQAAAVISMGLSLSDRQTDRQAGQPYQV